MFQDIATYRILGSGVKRGKLYYLDLHENPKSSQVNNVSSNKDRVILWHRRLGHLSFHYLRKIKPELFVGITNFESRCDICEMAKSHRISYVPSHNKNLVPFMTIHSDVWGPAQIPTLSGARYFVTFIDECTRMTWISLLSNKSDVNTAFQELYKMVSTQYQSKIRVLQSDNGGEYLNTTLKSFFHKHGIRHQTSCAGTPQQNGIAERKNRQLLEIVRASLFDMNVPREYWGEAVKSAAYIINRTPSRVLNFQTPIQKLQKLLPCPPFNNLEPRVFGCSAYVHQRLRKLDPRAIRCIFVSYAYLQKGYRCYDPNTKKMYVTRDVQFHENRDARTISSN